MSRQHDQARSEPPTGREPAAARPPTRPPTRRTVGNIEPLVLAAIALGGALGAPARYGVAQLANPDAGHFPWGTFWTNVTGSLALGFVLALVLERFPPTRYLRPFIATGFLGSFTTYSTFAVETDLLLKDGHTAIALTYAGTSLVAGCVAAWAGIWAGRAVPRSAAQRTGGRG
jgi:CrcB protein